MHFMFCFILFLGGGKGTVKAKTIFYFFMVKNIDITLKLVWFGFFLARLL